MIGKGWTLIMLLLLVPPVTFAGDILDNPEKPETGIADKIIKQQLFGNRKTGNDSMEEERYLCVPEMATGFKYNSNTKSWESVNFKVNRKYLISKGKPPKDLISGEYSKQSGLVIKIVGDELNICRDMSEAGFARSGFVNFDCFHGEFLVNQNRGKYIRTFRRGYVIGDETTTPFMEIGKCSPF